MLLLVAGAGGCLGGEPLPSESWRAQIGPEATCDPAAAGCWSEEDRARLAGVSSRLMAAASGSMPSRTDTMCEVARGVASFGYKLSPEQVAQVSAREAVLCGGGPLDEPALVAQAGGLLGEALMGLEGDMAAAYLAPLMDSESDAAPECPGCAGAYHLLATPGWVPETWPQGVREAMTWAGQHWTGELMVWIAVSQGVYDPEERLANNPEFSRLSEAQKVGWIREEATSRAMWIGAVSGVAAWATGAFAATGVGLVLGFAGTGAYHLWSTIGLRWWTVVQLQDALGGDSTAAPSAASAIFLALSGKQPPQYATLFALGMDGVFTFMFVTLLQAFADVVASDILVSSASAFAVLRVIFAPAAAVMGTIVDGCLMGQFIAEVVPVLKPESRHRLQFSCHY